LNRRNTRLVSAALEALPRRRRSAIYRRYEFLLDAGLRCFPLTPAAVPLTVELTVEFTNRHEAKANFRNTLNDISSVAVAALADLHFHTEDRLIGRFVVDLTDTVLESGRKSLEHWQNRETRGYINRPRILRGIPTIDPMVSS
jgi:hypothetical protein